MNKPEKSTSEAAPAAPAVAAFGARVPVATAPRVVPPPVTAAPAIEVVAQVRLRNCRAQAVDITVITVGGAEIGMRLPPHGQTEVRADRVGSFTRQLASQGVVKITPIA